MSARQAEVEFGVVDNIPDHELALLRASTQRDGSTIEHLEQYLSLRPEDVADHTARELFPLLFRRLEEDDVDHELRRDARKAYRLNWATNQRRVYRARALVEYLERRETPWALLKGGAMLSDCYYGDLGVRTIADLDVLVPPDRIRNVLDWGVAHGWPRKWELRLGQETALTIHHAVSLRDEDDGFEIDVHHSLLARDRSPELDAALLCTTEQTQLDDLNVRVPNPSLQLAHTLMHVRPLGLRHVADALDVVRLRGSDIDWDRVCSQVEQRRSITRALRTLEQMGTVTPHVVPPTVFDRLLAKRRHWSDRDVELTNSIRASAAKAWQHAPRGSLRRRWHVAQALYRQQRASR